MLTRGGFRTERAGAVYAYRVPKLTVRLSDDAHNGYERMSSEEGVTLTAFLEALGCELHEHRLRNLPAGPRIVERARKIDVERRARS